MVGKKEAFNPPSHSHGTNNLLRNLRFPRGTSACPPTIPNSNAAHDSINRMPRNGVESGPLYKIVVPFYTEDRGKNGTPCNHFGMAVFNE